ncbi:MAG: polysaccharide deacetylase family protein [Bacteroidota bacterium]
MKRRKFLQDTAMASMALGLPSQWFDAKTTHILSLSFDDGFKKSFYKVAEIHENYGLKACFNVIARGHFPDFKKIDDWILPELLGDFNDWNKLKGRGHEVMPHTWEHLNLTKVPLSKAKENIDRCLDYFEENLDGYKASEAVYNCAFLASTPELDAYTLKRTAAVRTGAWLVLEDTRLNMIPTATEPERLGAWSFGPDFGDKRVDKEINQFLKGPGGWLILNLHGVDDEGWGPIRSSYLDKLLKKLVKIDHLAILPVGEALKLGKS